MKKNKVWLCRDRDDEEMGYTSYRLHLVEPEWDVEGFWRSSDSISICSTAATSFLGEDEFLLEGECVEVNCTLGTVWEK